MLLAGCLGALIAVSTGCHTGTGLGAEKNPPPGFVSVFNGQDFSGWAGPIENYEVKDGALVCKPKMGGSILSPVAVS